MEGDLLRLDEALTDEIISKLENYLEAGLEETDPEGITGITPEELKEIEEIFSTGYLTEEQVKEFYKKYK